MADSTPTRFDFHVVRFMNSEDVELMSAEEIGQYLLLLCKAWLLGKEASLPDDQEYLAKQARSKKVSALVLKKFPLITTEFGPRRRNEVLYGEWLLAKDRQISASDRGKKGNETRYGTRYSESNSDNHSERTAITQAKTSSSPIPFHSIPDHTKPFQSTPDQSSVELTGGSFGQGSFKIISARWWSHFQKQLQKSKQNKEQYALACSQFNEDKILDYLEVWAKENSWVASHPKGGNRLYVFLQTLPEMIEGDSLRDARKTEEQKKEGPQISETGLRKIAEKIDEQRNQEVAAKKKQIEDQKKFEEETRDQI